MDVSVIPIGNSKGIRLSKTLLEKYHITDKVELIFGKRIYHFETQNRTQKWLGKSF